MGTIDENRYSSEDLQGQSLKPVAEEGVLPPQPRSIISLRRVPDRTRVGALLANQFSSFRNLYT
jgi:hypothetical protein